MTLRERPTRLRGLVALSTALLMPISLPAAADTIAGAKNEFHARVLQKRAAMIARVAGQDAADRFLREPKIIGGIQAPATAYPAQVGLLQSSVPGNFDAQFCGGTLVHAQWVLTAAHCVEDIVAASELQILTGTNDLSAGGNRRNVAKIVIHPQWNTTTNDFDIALVKLSVAATGIPLAALPRLADEPVFAPTGEPSRTVGWGDTLPGAGVSYPTKLQHVGIKIIARSVCNAATSYNGDVTLRMICAGVPAGGKDSCQGDSGGPLYVGDANNRYRVLAGVVSFGIGCGLADFPGVYARVPYFRRWILLSIAAG